MNRSRVEPISRGGEQHIALDQKELERAGLCLVLRSGAGEAILGHLSPSPSRLVRADAASIDCRPHACVNVVQMKAAPGQLDDERLIAEQRIKPDSRSPGGIMDVGADVQFEKIGQPRNAGEASRMHPPHEKRHNAQPTLARKGVDKKAGRQRLLNLLGVPRPMQEEQLLPTHPQNRGRLGPLAHKQAILDLRLSHGSA